MESRYIRCSCHDPQHYLHFQFDKEDEIIYASMGIDRATFWKRLKVGLNIIIGKKSADFIEIVLTKKEIEELERIVIDFRLSRTAEGFYRNTKDFVEELGSGLHTDLYERIMGKKE